MIEHKDSGKKGRFIIKENGEGLGEMTYTWAGKTKIIIDHTEVDERFTGKGFGKKMVFEAVSFARKNDIKILPLCPFAKRVFDTNTSINDVRF